MWKNMDKFKNLSTFYHINYNKKFIILKYNFFIKRLDLKILVLTYGCSIVKHIAVSPLKFTVTASKFKYSTWF